MWHGRKLVCAHGGVHAHHEWPAAGALPLPFCFLKVGHGAVRERGGAPVQRGLWPEGGARATPGSYTGTHKHRFNKHGQGSSCPSPREDAIS